MFYLEECENCGRSGSVALAEGDTLCNICKVTEKKEDEEKEESEEE